MAQSPESIRLTAQYQLAQRALGLQVVAAVRQSWRSLDTTAVDKGWPRVAAALSRVIAAGHARSSAQALVYLARHADLNGVAVSPVVGGGLAAERVSTALEVTGPVALKRSTALDATRASQSALVQLSGAAQRLTLAGGRDAVVATVSASPHLVGWQRVGEGRCQFCADLIAAGPVYGRDASEFAAHDHDSCIPEPVYE